MTSLAIVFGAAFLALGAAIVGTYLFLAIVALFPRRPRPAAATGAPTSFVILIPAHDEEDAIPATLDSCRALDYPPERFTVRVIADNCRDATARRARERGAECLERTDPAHAGKGFALEFGLARCDWARHDAAVVLDADCAIDRHALSVFDRELRAGARALQAADRVSNPDASATSYALAVGNCLENDLFYAPKSALGGVVLLRGTGMALHRDLLARFPWGAHSIAEDAEYALTLLRGGVRIHFVSDAAVHSAFPAGGGALRVQRRRWASGSLGLARRQVARLFWDGLRTGRGALCDAAWTLTVLSRPLAILSLALALGLGLAAGSRALAFAAAASLVLLAAYFALGVARLGVTRRRIMLLLGAPFVVAQLVAISLAALARRAPGAWARTPRA